MTDTCKTFRDCRFTVRLSILEVLNLYTIPSGFYGSPNEQNWMCEICTFWFRKVVYIDESFDGIQSIHEKSASHSVVQKTLKLIVSIYSS